MIEFKVTGMTCAHCVQAVMRAVQGVPGVSEVSVDLASGRVRVLGEPDAAAAVAAIAAEGYAADRL